MAAMQGIYDGIGIGGSANRFGYVGAIHNANAGCSEDAMHGGTSAADSVISAALGLLRVASTSALEQLVSACAQELARRTAAAVEQAFKRRRLNDHDDAAATLVHNDANMRCPQTSSVDCAPPKDATVGCSTRSDAATAADKGEAAEGPAQSDTLAATQKGRDTECQTKYGVAAATRNDETTGRPTTVDATIAPEGASTECRTNCVVAAAASNDKTTGCPTTSDATTTAREDTTTKRQTKSDVCTTVQHDIIMECPSNADRVPAIHNDKPNECSKKSGATAVVPQEVIRECATKSDIDSATKQGTMASHTTEDEVAVVEEKSLQGTEATEATQAAQKELEKGQVNTAEATEATQAAQKELEKGQGNTAEATEATQAAQKELEKGQGNTAEVSIKNVLQREHDIDRAMLHNKPRLPKTPPLQSVDVKNVLQRETDLHAGKPQKRRWRDLSNQASAEDVETPPQAASPPQSIREAEEAAGNIRTKVEPTSSPPHAAEKVSRTAGEVSEAEEDVESVQADIDIAEASGCVEPDNEADAEESNLKAWPRISDFRDATEAETKEFPYIMAAFVEYMTENCTKVSEATRWQYAKNVRQLFRFDNKAPSEMATEAYLEAVTFTLEDYSNHRQSSNSLKYFNAFWKKRGAAPFHGASDAPEDVAKQFQVGERRERIAANSGDGSAEARATEELPEGWHVHSRARCGRLLGWSSPGGNFYFSKKHLDIRLGRVVQKLEKLGTPPKQSKNDGAEDAETPEPVEKEPPKPLAELLGPPREEEKATAEDRNILPRVLATFARHLQEQAGPRRQSTRDGYVVQFFKIFSRCERSLEVMADPRFADLVASSEDSKRCHNNIGSAVRHFGHFWREIGGYKGTFDQASREYLNLALNVKPQLVELGGTCGYCLAAGDLCRKPRQRCETCGSNFRCSQHDDHSIVDCREVFWATHTPSGARARTMKDFFRKPASAVGGSTASAAAHGV